MEDFLKRIMIKYAELPLSLSPLITCTGPLKGGVEEQQQRLDRQMAVGFYSGGGRYYNDKKVKAVHLSGDKLSLSVSI